ncbi:AAA family ATPase [Leucothrix arctica]|uniref:ATPase AAA-type core domain-containing protein n=1 Tax=Leucothrix arctica TaxID=1481894 RepID=A0A317CFQ8_9GAMM|nr:AAA family ATPase [Leucothrix arctica]PWQ96233.1 hypothetical protein DKT75_09575 [Leucothrix arctica]
MIIQEIYYFDARRKIEIKEMKFDKFNALVGVSGAGKTTIIRAIDAILNIVSGNSEPADNWKISFLDDDNNEIVWEGIYSKNIEFDDKGDDISELTAESLFKNGEEIINRRKSSTIYNGEKLPVIDKYKSLMYVLRDDPLIAPIYKSLKSIIIILNNSTGHSHTGATAIFNPKSIENTKKRINSNKEDILKILNEEKANCRKRIFYIHKYRSDMFDEFLFTYTNIFPDVVNIIPEIKRSRSNKSPRDTSALYIKLKMKSGAIVEQSEISSGMFKTMMILSELMFGNKKSPIIIDEIENSLGINCLSEIAAELKSSENQIIITTHHPQVIEGTDPKFYRIIKRDGGVITSDPAEEIKGSSSHHDRFIQLINSSQYKGF